MGTLKRFWVFVRVLHAGGLRGGAVGGGAVRGHVLPHKLAGLVVVNEEEEA